MTLPLFAIDAAGKTMSPPLEVVKNIISSDDVSGWSVMIVILKSLVFLIILSDIINGPPIET